MASATSTTGSTAGNSSTTATAAGAGIGAGGRFAAGFRTAGVYAGLKAPLHKLTRQPNLDIALIVSETPCAAAGVFTKVR